MSQLRSPPEVLGDGRLAGLFEQHLAETKEQERRLRERLQAHGAEPSTAENAAGRIDRIGAPFFIVEEPDTPAELLAHAFSYQHLEVAAYELLRLSAERAGDEATVGIAREIAEEEEAMAKRLEASFEAVVEVSLRDADQPAIELQLNRSLTGAHAIERQTLQLLDVAPKLVEDAELKRIFVEHLVETEDHLELLERRLEARQAEPSKAKDAALRFGGRSAGAFFSDQADPAAKLTGFAFALEHLESAAYELLAGMARRAGDRKTEAVATWIAAEEREAARKLGSNLDRAISPRRVA